MLLILAATIAQAGAPPPAPPSFASAHAGLGRQPSRIVQANEFACGDRNWRTVLEVSPTIRPGTSPSTRLTSLMIGGRAVPPSRTAELSTRLARLASFESVFMMCDENGTDVLTVVGDAMNAQGARTRTRVVARLDRTGPVTVSIGDR